MSGRKKYVLMFVDKDRRKKLIPDTSGSKNLTKESQKIYYLVFRTIQVLRRVDINPNVVYICDDWLGFLGFPNTLLDITCMGRPGRPEVEEIVVESLKDQSTATFILAAVKPEDCNNISNLEFV